MSDAKTTRWNLPPLLLYCFVFFFLAILCGAQGVPGVFVLAPGLALGVVAAWRGWFELKERGERAPADAKHYVPRGKSNSRTKAQSKGG